MEQLDRSFLYSRSQIWYVITFSSLSSGFRRLPISIIARCSLTFLAIKEPGISKYCENCNREFLNEYTIQDKSAYANEPPVAAPRTPLERLAPLHPRASVEELADVTVFDDHLRRIGHDGEVVDLEAFRRPPRSLAATFFHTYGVCPYCGGKYVG